MPHCILEYSGNVIDEPDGSATLAALHRVLMATGLFVLDDIKSRLVRRDDFLVGDGRGDRAFVALEIQILSGRTDEVKGEICDAALQVLVRAFPRTVEKMTTSLTVQISDIHRPSYRREIRSAG
ncbi:MAG: 5-carboxymethyl-2-hydroxymuconate Delta-isomerase [Thermoanaerobaculia bacterium]